MALVPAAPAPAEDKLAFGRPRRRSSCAVPAGWALFHHHKMRATIIVEIASIARSIVMGCEILVIKLFGIIPVCWGVVGLGRVTVGKEPRDYVGWNSPHKWCLAVSGLVHNARILLTLLPRATPGPVVAFELEDEFAVLLVVVLVDVVIVIQRVGLRRRDEGNMEAFARCVYNEDVLWQRWHTHCQ